MFIYFLPFYRSLIRQVMPSFEAGHRPLDGEGPATDLLQLRFRIAVAESGLKRHGRSWWANGVLERHGRHRGLPPSATPISEGAEIRVFASDWGAQNPG